MKERPILFSAPMVRAILDGSKTQTRRVVKPQPDRLPVLVHPSIGNWVIPDEDGRLMSGASILCPYGQPNDRLWVRETWQAVHYSTDYETGIIDDEDAAPKIPKDNSGQWWTVKYAATHPDGSAPPSDRVPWRPAIHMPRWASRITLAVESIRVERLHDIAEDDARAEGAPYYVNGHGPVTDAEINCDGGYHGCGAYRAGFETLWTEINGAESWDANPWVWVVGFSRVAP